jgi:C-terminal processing protease CtpA/Prc
MYVLTNGHSFSTGAHFPSLVKEYNLGRVVGVETGGLVGGSFGEHIFVNLPKTRLPLGISTSILKHKNTGDFKSHGVIPDYHIHRDIKKEIQGVDSQLEKTIQFIMSAADSSAN